MEVSLEIKCKKCSYLPSAKMTSCELENLFDTQDVDGNESEMVESDSKESDMAGKNETQEEQIGSSSDEDETVQPATLQASSSSQAFPLYTKTMQTLMFLDSY